MTDDDDVPLYQLQAAIFDVEDVIDRELLQQAEEITQE